MRLKDEDLVVLCRAPLFEGLPQSGVEKLVSRGSVEIAPRGRVLFLHGDPADRFYAVLDGWVKLWRETAAGDETVVGLFTRGETFAEAAMFDARIFPVNAEVAESARLLAIPAEPFIKELEADFDLVLRILGSMSRHMRGLVAQLEQVHARSAPQRVAGFLLRLQPEIAGSVAIRLPFDKSLVAARLGMRPETFSRALMKLRGFGVESEGNAIVIPDPAELRRFCEG